MSLFLKNLKDTNIKIVDVLPSSSSALYIIVQDEKGDKLFVKHYVDDDDDRAVDENKMMSMVKDLDISPRMSSLPTTIPHVCSKYFEQEHISYRSKFNYGAEILRVYKILAKNGILYTDCKLRNMILDNGKLFIIDWDSWFIYTNNGLTYDKLLACMLFQFLAIQLLVFDKIDTSVILFIWNELNKLQHVFHDIWDGVYITGDIIHSYLQRTNWDPSMYISPSRLRSLSGADPFNANRETQIEGVKSFGVYYKTVAEIIECKSITFEDPRGIIIISDYTLPIKKVERITY